MKTIIRSISALALVVAINAAPAHAALSTDLSYGDQGAQVTELQNVLTKLGYFSQKATGYFGSVTQAALTAYQNSAGLAAVGALTPETSSSLNAYSAFSASTTPAVSLSFDMSGAEVTKLQDNLRTLGYLNHVSTGYYGPLTQAAVRAFQSAHALPVTGAADAQTNALIINAAGI